MASHNRSHSSLVFKHNPRRAHLVGAHQPAITGYIRDQNRGQPPFGAAMTRMVHQPFLRRHSTPEYQQACRDRASGIGPTDQQDNFSFNDPSDDRLGSLADILAVSSHVRSSPKSGHC
jgi:hypothetical protein